MKKIFLINLAVIMVISSVLYTSCKKPFHPAHPTPVNNRLLSYTKFSTTTIPGIRAVNETFTFYYDAQKRVSQILYSSNDSLRLSDGTQELSITFTYSNNTIYKTTTKVYTATVIERDTFTLDLLSGLITDALTPGAINHFEYFGKLISSTIKKSYDSGTIIYAGLTYTSDNGDLLNSAYNGNLNATFPDSGLLDMGGGLLQHASLNPPLTVTWTDYGSTPVNTIHAGVPGRSDVLTNYTSGDPVSIKAVDNFGVIAYDTCFWPGGMWPRESFFVYPDLLDRTGDYLQIESYTMYGYNIYQNQHLVRKIIEQNGPTTEITYTIDADSKITQTYVKKTDALYNVYTTVYKFQYATY